MDELISVMEEIRDLLIDIDSKLDNLKDNSDEISSSLDDVKGSGLYSIDDIYGKLMDIELAVE